MSFARPRHTAAQKSASVKAISRQVRKALFDAAIGAASPATDHTALTVERAATPTAPERLSRSNPGDAAARAQARAMYERCLTHYRSVVRAQEARSTHDDVGAAVACFVAANMQALHGLSATPDMLLRLERQLGGIVQRSASWSTASAQERQFYFEQMAILAVLISESTSLARTQGPAALANVQRAARGYLQQLLGLEPRALALDSHGLRLADCVQGAEHAVA
jgi:hypothetical protein